jgi:four helix bundle protein
MDSQFDHEKLNVYQSAISFIEWLNPVFDSVPKSLAARDQLDRASTSIPLNIAEGNGKFTENDRCKFFDIARGSALECAACLDVLAAKHAITRDLATEGKTMLVAVVSMLVGLIKSNFSWRVHEESASYPSSSQS